MLYILSGQDDFSLGQSLEEIKKGAADPALLMANTTILDGQQVTVDQLKTVAETLPFLAERRLVIINGLLERFEPKGRPGRQRKITEATNQQSVSKSFAACLSQIPDSTVLVLRDREVTSKNPLFQEVADKAKVSSFPLLRGTKLHQWIQKRVIEESGSISPRAVDLLAKLVGGNLWIMASEIDKLVLFASGRRIEEEDVNSVVSDAQQTNVFAMVDAILESRVGRAEQLLQWLLQRGAASAYLLLMLSRQVHMIVRAKELRSQGKSKIEIQNKLGVAEFALHKVLEQAEKYPLGRLKKVYAQLLETDLSIKTGKYEGELALNILVATLCQS